MKLLKDTSLSLWQPIYFSVPCQLVLCLYQLLIIMLCLWLYTCIYMHKYICCFHWNCDCLMLEICIFIWLYHFCTFCCSQSACKIVHIFMQWQLYCFKYLVWYKICKCIYNSVNIDQFVLYFVCMVYFIHFYTFEIDTIIICIINMHYSFSINEDRRHKKGNWFQREEFFTTEDKYFSNDTDDILLPINHNLKPNYTNANISRQTIYLFSISFLRCLID